MLTLSLIMYILSIPIILEFSITRYALGKFTENGVIISSLLAFMPIFNCIYAIVALIEGIDNRYDVKEKLSQLNNIANCRNCNITSRAWQLVGDHKDKCPHCNYGSLYSSNRNKEKTYPFAKKINKRSLIKYLINENKIKKIKDELEQVTRIDIEMGNWQKLQQKKLKDMQLQMEKIKNDIKKSEEHHNGQSIHY